MKTLSEQSISVLHNFCARKGMHIEVVDINKDFVLLHRNQKEWI